MAPVIPTLIRSRGQAFCFLGTSPDILGLEMKPTGWEHLLPPPSRPRRVIYGDLLGPWLHFGVIVLREDFVSASNAFLIGSAVYSRWQLTCKILL